MQGLYNYIESVLLTIEGVNQVNLLIDETELDLLQDRKSGFVGVTFNNVNLISYETISIGFVFENALDQERYTYLYQQDVLKKIISEFKREVSASKEYLFPNEWNLNPFTNKSVNKTCGYFFDLEVSLLFGNACKVEKI